MKTTTFVVGAMLGTVGVLGAALAAEKSADGCSILNAAEVQTLAGSAKVDATPSTDALGTRSCQYKWGTGANVQGGKSYLNVNVTETSKAFPGMDAATLRESLLARVKMAQPPALAGVINGVGDAATWESNAPIRVETTAFAKGKVVALSFESLDARGQKDRVVALLKAVAGRL